MSQTLNVRKELKLGSLLSYVSLFVSNIIGILYTPIMLSLMGQSEYGLYSLVASVVGYLTVLDMGLGNSIIRYTSRYRALNDTESESKMYGMFLILYSIIALFIVVIGSVMYGNIHLFFGSSLTSFEVEKISIMLILMIFNLAISFPLGVYGSILTAHERFVFPRVVNIVRSIVFPLIMLPLLLMGYRSVTMILVTTILNVVVMSLNVYYCYSKLKIKITFAKWDFRLLKELAGYSFFIFLNIIIDKLYWSTDQVILGVVSGTSMVAIYAIGAQLNTYFLSFSTAISGVFLPRITTLIAKGVGMADVSKLFIKVSRIQFFIMSFILSGFLLFGYEFILVWAGQDYGQSYIIACIVMVPSIIPLTQNIAISVLQAQNKHQFRSVLYIFIAIANVVLSIPFAMKWGGIGCAIATSLATITGQIIIMNIYYHRVIKLDIVGYWKEILQILRGVSLAFVVGLIYVNVFELSTVLSLVIGIVVYSIVHIILTWTLSMKDHEKELVANFVKSVIGKINVKFN